MGSKRSIFGKYVTSVGVVDRIVNAGIGAWGAFVAARPVLTITISSVVALALSGGLALIGQNTETDPDKLWVPQDSIWIKLESYLAPRFGILDRAVQVIFEAKDGSNVLTADSIRDMFSVYDTVAALKQDDEGKTATWTDGICWKSARNNGNDCRTDGILNFFDDNITMFESIAAQGQAALLEALSVDTYPDGGVVSPDGLFVDAVRDSNGILQSARLVIWIGIVAPDAEDSVIDGWSTDIEDALEPGTKNAPSFSTIDYYLSAPNSIKEAIGQSVSGDIPLIAAAVVVICSFCTLALFVKDRVANRTSLALLGIVTVCLSISAGFGLSLYLQIPFTNLSQVLPFILLGIGVDDIFVLVRSVEEVDALEPNLPLPLRFRKALNLGGMSITVTSVTNATAFMFGSMSAIPAIRWFCWSAAIAIVLDWALQLTFFLGCFVITERRIINSRYDCLCCFKRKTSEIAHPGIAPRKPVGLMSANKDSGLQALLNKYLLPALFHPLGKITILLAAVAVAVVGGIGITKLREGLPLGSLAPDDHYFRDFDAAYSKFESNSGLSADVFFRYMDQSDPTIQKKMKSAYEQLLTADYIGAELSPSQNWLTAFQQYAEQQGAANVDGEGAVRQAVFYDLLDDFLITQPGWKDDVYRVDGQEQGPIEVSSFKYVHTANENDDGGYERKLVSEMHDIGEDVNNDVFSAENDGTDEGNVAILSGPTYKFIEADRIIFREMIYNLGFALLGIAIIGLILLIHPVAVLIIVLCIVLVDLALFAEMWFFDIRLNTVSVVNLVMAVGLAVDYSMHILHTFLHKSGKSRQERVHAAMLQIGAAVLLGVLSTLLGVVVLAGSQSHLIRTFFQLLTGTVIFGGIVGLLFLPVLLSFSGPGPCLINEEQEVVHEIQEAEDKQKFVEDA